MYGISAVRYDTQQGPCISEVLMGLLAADGRYWESAPVPVALVEVVDRLTVRFRFAIRAAWLTFP